MHAIHSLTPGLTTLGVTDTEACIAEICKYEEITNIHLSPLHDGIKETLDALAKNQENRRALVTSASPTTIELCFRRHSLERYFHSVVTPDRVTERKPSPVPVLAALEELGGLGAKEYAIMIGDSVADVMAGRAAGVKTAVHYPAAHEKMYTLRTIRDLKPNYIIRDFGELLDLV